MFSSVRDVLTYIKSNNIAMVDLKIVGLAGQWLHVSIPAMQVNERLFEAGEGYDGSSGSGFGTVESGDVSALPRVETAFLDPFFQVPTLSFLCDTVTADTHEPFPHDPRTIARRAVAHMRQLGVADEAWMAPEFEFHVLDRVMVRVEPYDVAVSVRSAEVHSEGLTSAIPLKGGYFRVPPGEQLNDLRSEIALTLERLNVPVRYHHHEVGASGQCEIEVKGQPLLRAADQAMLVKYVIKNVARKHGRIATFMPKPIFGEAGNGMHVHQRLTLKGRPLFFDERRKNYANLSELALHYVGGLLTHGAALTGLTNPSTNSYKRLVEGYEAPVNLFYSLANRSAAVRVPRYAEAPDEKRIEYRPPDFTGNVYLTLAAMLMAGLDGIAHQTDPRAHGLGPFDVDIAKQPEDFRKRIAAVPRALQDALDALWADRAFLTRGEVFSEALLDGWVRGKREEARDIAIRPHPYEFVLHLDA